MRLAGGEWRRTAGEPIWRAGRAVGAVFGGLLEGRAVDSRGGAGQYRGGPGGVPAGFPALSCELFQIERASGECCWMS